MADWTLVGTGPKKAGDWPTLVSELDGWQAGWADLAGFHLEQLPPVLPLATHVWAWRRNGWMRARVDGATWVASALFRNTVPDSPLWARNREKPPDVTVTKIASWARTDGRVHQLVLAGSAELPEAMWQLTPVCATTTVFVGTLETLG